MEAVVVQAETVPMTGFWHRLNRRIFPTYASEPHRAIAHGIRVALGAIAETWRILRMDPR